MALRRSLGPQFRWLWAAYTASTFGTWLGFGAFPLIAITVLHSGPSEVSLLITGTLRAVWPLGLPFVGRGASGLGLIIAVQFGLVMCCGIFNPVLATFRLEQIAADRVARTLSAWSITSNLTTATLTALWGLLASMTSPRVAIATAGVLLLATPLLLPRRGYRRESDAKLAPSLTL